MKARAKINIALEVTGKRGDGYHNLKSVMQTVELYDDIVIKKSPRDKGLFFSCDDNRLTSDERNLAYRAAVYMIERYNLNSGIHINLKKNIPISAGLGGGSSDCAAVIVGLRDLFRLPLSKHELAEIGVRFGADVPFCIFGGTMLAEGIGDVLTSLPPFPDIYVLLAKPDIEISTAEIFNKFSTEHYCGDTDFGLLIESIRFKNLRGISNQMKNALERVTIARYGIIEKLKIEMMKNGAIGSLMSGSGATVFGLFENKGDMEITAAMIKQKFHEVKEVISTKIFNSIRLGEEDATTTQN